jgi:hypothetical protein
MPCFGAYPSLVCHICRSAYNPLPTSHPVPVTITIERNERKPDWFWGGNMSAIGLVTGGLTLIAFIVATVAGIFKSKA